MKPFKNYYILPADVAECREAIKWYASRKVRGWSHRFAKTVKATIMQILDNPGAFAIRYKNIRIVPATAFPSAIHFFLKTMPLLLR